MSISRTKIMVAYIIAGTLSACVPSTCRSADTVYGFDLENKATATVSVSLLALGTDTFRYVYSVTNLASSERPIWEFALQLEPPFKSVRPLRSPSNWRGPSCCNLDNVRQGHTGISTVMWSYSGSDERYLPPGLTASGFGYTSVGLPAIRRYFVTSYAEHVIPQAEPDPDSQDGGVDPEVNLWDFFNNSTSGLTLGPEIVPSESGLDSLIERLVSLKHQALKSDWLGDAKFVLKLDRRLDEAKAALAGGKPALARIRLTQFVHDLTEVHKERGEEERLRVSDKERDEHRREPFVNDDAYQLLEINADYIIAKLPEKAKGRDEEEECRRAEAEMDGGGAKAGSGGHGSPGNDR